MDITIKLSMPEQGKEQAKHKELMEKVCDYILCCESDRDSGYHFNYLKSLYKQLADKPNIPSRLIPVFEKLEEFLLKQDIDRTVIDSLNLNKHSSDDDE